jgi:hypothetical protein
METLMQEISNNIRMSVHSFIKKVSDKHDLDFDELIIMWENSGKNDIFQPKQVAKPIGKKEKPSKVIDFDQEKDLFGTDSGSDSGHKNTKSVKTRTSPSGCPYIYTKGEKEGQSCGINPKGSVVYCTRHKKYEGQEPKQKKIVPSAKKSIAGSTPSKVSAPVAKEVNIVLRKNKVIDKLWHSATGMVFKSAKERIVIGKFVDDKLLPLSKEDIDICMSHSFAYDESWKGDEIEETITHLPVVEKKKSISDAITEANIKASDIDLILCELQIDKKTSSDDEDLDEDEDLLEEEDN